MATLTKLASSNTTVSGTAFTNPTNAYADDTSYATLASSTKNVTVGTHDWGFAGITTGEIPDGATISAVRIVSELGLTAIGTGFVMGLLPVENNVSAGTEQTKTTVGLGVLTATLTTPTTLANLRTAGWVEGRIRYTRGNSTSASTAQVDYLRLEVDYTISDPQLVTPSTAALTTATFAPTVTATANTLVTPSMVALTTATFAPTVTATAHQSVTPTTAALALSTFAPTVTVAGGGITVTPSVASLSLATFAPSVLTPIAVIPTTAALTLSPFAPTVTATAHQTVIPSTVSLILTMFAPTVTGGAGLTVTPGVATLSMTGFAPTVSTTQNQLVTPDPATLALALFAPTVVNPQSVTPGPLALNLTTFAPTVSNLAFIEGGIAPGSFAMSSAPQTGTATTSLASGSSALGVPTASASSLNPE
ncbi:MAG: hypothetical protein M3N43_14695 [Actinomycetota bacterium]|nr:hypothetical protein [Actinomycetota bacterium]